MRRTILSKAGFSAAVALMLAFGAREAFSAPAATAAQSAIMCETNEECQEYCEFRYPGQNVEGWCDNPPYGHCHCDFW
jgi:hypothetical protein